MNKSPSPNRPSRREMLAIFAATTPREMPPKRRHLYMVSARNDAERRMWGKL